MSASFSFTFPSIRGLQAGREYYVSMCPLRLIPRIFLFDEEEVPPEIRAQRLLNRNRVPQMVRYILENEEDYVFSALTASIDGDVEFEPISNDPSETQLGTLHVPMTAKFIINDGQHRRAAIEEAIREVPELRDETIAVVFFIDTGLKRSQQMFADLNRYAVRPSKSISVLYDHRDILSESVATYVLSSPYYKQLVDRHRTSLAKRSMKLFTLSSFHSASQQLTAGLEHLEKDTLKELISSFWDELYTVFPDWEAVFDRKRTAGDIRESSIHSYAVTLQALGRIGNYLFKEEESEWQAHLQKLRNVDWSRDNVQWEGAPVVNGSIRNSVSMVQQTAIRIKKMTKIPLSNDEQQAERQ